VALAEMSLGLIQAFGLEIIIALVAPVLFLTLVLGDKVGKYPTDRGNPGSKRHFVSD
jgi:hypothetical protein